MSLLEKSRHMEFLFEKSWDITVKVCMGLLGSVKCIFAIMRATKVSADQSVTQTPYSIFHNYKACGFTWADT